jgi:hypothetical protein
MTMLSKVALGFVLTFAITPASSEPIRKKAAIVADQDMSSRYLCDCRRHSQHRRVVQVHKRYLTYRWPSYVTAPWHSAQYFPKYVYRVSVR